MKPEEEKKIKYPVFKQLLESFYQDELNQIEESNSEKIRGYEKIKLIPTILYEKRSNEIRLEFNIGIDKMYKLKSLSEFYDRIIKHETFQYGKNLKFVHKKEYFSEDSKDLLKFMLRYAEVIKYANSGTYNRFRYYGKEINDDYILINTSRIDDIFSVLKGRTVELERNYVKSELKLIDNEPDFEFSLVKISEEEYMVFPNFDVEKCHIIDGINYSYLIYNKKVYKCSKEYALHELRIIRILNENYQTNMKLSKHELKDFFSLIFPRIKNSILYEEDAKLEQYIPKTLKTKIYFDSDKDRNIIANIRFCYEEEEFNPFKDIKSFPRDVITEAKILDYFRQKGFLFDKVKGNLILKNEEKIYELLTHDLEEYEKEYEVLVSQDFKEKQIRAPKITGIGVKIENNLLKLDLQKLNIDKSELKEVLKQYHLKKKYYRLNDGTLLDFYNNSDIEFIDTLVSNMGVTYKEIRRRFCELTTS